MNRVDCGLSLTEIYSSQDVPLQGCAFYEAMFARLVEIEPLSDTAPQVLAAQRAQAIVDALVKAGSTATGCNRAVSRR